MVSLFYEYIYWIASVPIKIIFRHIWVLFRYRHNSCIVYTILCLKLKYYNFKWIERAILLLHNGDNRKHL